MGFFSRLFGKKKFDESKYLKDDSEMKRQAEEKKTSSTTETSEHYTAQKKKESYVKEIKPKNTDISQKASHKPISDKKKAEQQTEDDSLADKIVNDKSSTSIKINGLSGFFDIKKSKDNRYVFNLYASNKVIIATSQVYSSSQSAINGANSVIANAEKANIEDQTLKNFIPQAFPKWEIYKDKGGQYRFRLSASNGSCICHSQGYTTKASCKNGIESIIRTVKDVKIDKTYLKK